MHDNEIVTKIKIILPVRLTFPQRQKSLFLKK